LTFEQIHSAILKGVAKAENIYPMAVGLICIVQRILPVSDAGRVIDFAIAHKDSFVGVDLADNEEGFDSKPFAPLFLKAKKAGLGITIHSGEAPHPKAPRWVMDAVEVLQADRIGHGLQIIHDPNVMKQIKERGVVLELCPTSNMLTNAVDDLKNHPLKKLFEAGVPVTINTDDPGIFNTNLNREYRIANEVLGMSFADLEACAQLAAERSFIDKTKRQGVWPKPLAR
jgi:adenosine deaminase